jgi:hypothetical protein
MSDTPETDAAAHNIGSFQQPHYVVDVEVAQDLERRLREVERERDALKRGEFICQTCGLRKDGEHEPADF